MKSKAEILQEEYYTKTAARYNEMHVSSDIEGDEHNMALYYLSAMIKSFRIQSILDVGSGTGRAIAFIKREFPEIRLMGIEPVKELREQGYRDGISAEILIDGDGNHIQFGDNEFDLVCEFGVLHHVPHPEKMISEMMRVAGRFIFISDSNNFAQGGCWARTMKQTINFFGLWKLYNYVRTKGKLYQISEGDGLYYSYSVFNNLKQIRKKCGTVYFIGANKGGVNLYKSAPYVILMGRKNRSIKV